MLKIPTVSIPLYTKSLLLSSPSPQPTPEMGRKICEWAR